MAETFTFELVSPERLLFSGEASQVVVPGREGYFTVMANHSPFLSTLRPGLLDVTLADGSVESTYIRGGFADTADSGLTILAEQAIPVAEINADDLAQEVKNAEEDVADAKDDEVKAEAELRLAHLNDIRAALSADGRI